MFRLVRVAIANNKWWKLGFPTNKKVYSSNCKSDTVVPDFSYKRFRSADIRIYLKTYREVLLAKSANEDLCESFFSDFFNKVHEFPIWDRRRVSREIFMLTFTLRFVQKLNFYQLFITSLGQYLYFDDLFRIFALLRRNTYRPKLSMYHYLFQRLETDDVYRMDKKKKILIDWMKKDRQWPDWDDLSRRIEHGLTLQAASVLLESYHINLIPPTFLMHTAKVAVGRKDQKYLENVMLLSLKDQHILNLLRMSSKTSLAEITKLLKLAYNRKNFELVQLLHEHAVKNHPNLDIRYLTVLVAGELDRFSRQSHFTVTKVLRLLAQVYGHPHLRPDYRIYTKLLWAAANFKDTKQGHLFAKHILQISLAAGYSVDQRMLTELLRLYANQGDVNNVKRLTRTNKALDQIASNVVLNAFAQSGDVEGAWKWYDNMSHRDVWTFTTLATTYLKSGRVGVVNVWRLTRLSRVRPTAELVRAIIGACQNKEELEFIAFELERFPELSGYTKVLLERQLQQISQSSSLNGSCSSLKAKFHSS